jgi:hypothetical protein
MSSPVKQFHYVYAMSCSRDHYGLKDKPAKVIQEMEAFQSWEHARYKIEKKGGMHSNPRQKKRVQGSYLEGYLWKDGMTNWREEATKISKDYILQPHDRVILMRKPMKVGQRPYVPEIFMQDQIQANMDKEEKEQQNQLDALLKLRKKKEQEITADMTEEEKMKAILAQATDQFSVISAPRAHHQQNRKRYGQVHASDMADNPEALIPPSYYVCHRCGEGGHYKHHCPTLSDISFVPVRARKAPTGIPKSMLRAATDEEKDRGAMVGSDGQYFMMKAPLENSIKVDPTVRKELEEAAKPDPDEYLTPMEIVAKQKEEELRETRQMEERKRRDERRRGRGRDGRSSRSGSRDSRHTRNRNKRSREAFSSLPEPPVKRVREDRVDSQTPQYGKNLTQRSRNRVYKRKNSK